MLVKGLQAHRLVLAHCELLLQMYMIMDALADGGVYAGVPKSLALKLTAYTMIVSLCVCEFNFLYIYSSM